MSAPQLGRLTREANIIVCCGAGGVGKTTASGALALAGARAGRRVLVLTIDPSKRLAQALGVSSNPPAPVRLDKVKGPGTLDAWMLDPKLVADEAVRRIVKNPGDIEKLFQNRIYQHVTSMVAGMHEYTAMQALHRFVLEGRYDLVVLDTPPSRHALDFLEAPGRLSRFLDGRVFRMFMPSGGGGGARRFAGGLVNRVLGSVLGDQFASDLAVFFGTFAGVLSTISRDVTVMREFLSGPGVAFLLVTSPAPAALEEALFFQGKTGELKLPFKGFVLNRSNAVGAENRTAPTLEALSRFAGPGGLGQGVRRALPRLRELADTELELIERDRTLLDDLSRRAGAGGFAEALPSLAHDRPEFDQLIALSSEIG